MPTPATPENAPGRPTGPNRRTLLGAAASAGAALALTTPAATASAASRTNASAWPQQTLSGSATREVAPDQFMPLSQMHTWQEAIDAIGLRATGTRSHHAYIDDLAARMERVGIRNVTTDPVPLNRWQPSAWQLDVTGGQNAGPVNVSWYVPYSGNTGPQGITAPLSLKPVKGAIGLVTVKPPSLPYGLIDLINWDAPSSPNIPPATTRSPPTTAPGSPAAASSQNSTNTRKPAPPASSSSSTCPPRPPKASTCPTTASSATCPPSSSTATPVPPSPKPPRTAPPSDCAWKQTSRRSPRPTCTASSRAPPTNS
ncbi:hypothetical protein [Streptomyces sp. NPDC008150]|uniref:hypothetical protein n=1 Tax=Streptomyces sp. NPDC008150 TaxID=3364816 RepID=UPI0036E1E2B2